MPTHTILTWIERAVVPLPRRTTTNAAQTFPLVMSSRLFMQDCSKDPKTALFKHGANTGQIVHLTTGFCVVLTASPPAPAPPPPPPPPACGSSGPLAKFPVCDTTLSAEARAIDLVGRLTLQEKIAMMSTTNKGRSSRWWVRVRGEGQALFRVGVRVKHNSECEVSVAVRVGLRASQGQCSLNSRSSLIYICFSPTHHT